MNATGVDRWQLGWQTLSLLGGLRQPGQGSSWLLLLAGVWFLLAIVLAAEAAAQDYSRPVTVAPQPDDIGADYRLPQVQHVAPRSAWWYLADVVLLALALVAMAMVNHRWRRRSMAVAITVASLAYFGFYRQGCVCPIGSIQNVTAALADPTLAVPMAVLALFLLPLLAALLVGRVFCGGVCPLGAIQDLVVLRPVQLPRAVDRWGGLFKYVYLGLAIWFAALPPPERDFVICRFDPFVGFFRLSGTAWILAVGGGLLALGTVVGRPYCRFLCPYGGLLAVVSRFAWKPVQITPDEELDCGLCVESCPFGAIRNLRADRATCLACARCFAHCPRQQLGWGEIDLADVEALRKVEGAHQGGPSPQAMSNHEMPSAASGRNSDIILSRALRGQGSRPGTGATVPTPVRDEGDRRLWDGILWSLRSLQNDGFQYVRTKLRNRPLTVRRTRK